MNRVYLNVDESIDQQPIAPRFVFIVALAHVMELYEVGGDGLK